MDLAPFEMTQGKKQRLFSHYDSKIKRKEKQNKEYKHYLNKQTKFELFVTRLKMSFFNEYVFLIKTKMNL